MSEQTPEPPEVKDPANAGKPKPTAYRFFDKVIWPGIVMFLIISLAAANGWFG